MHVTLKKSPPKKKKKETAQEISGWFAEKEKHQSREERTADKFIAEEPTIEYVDIEENTPEDSNEPAAKGTATAHFIKFINELLDIMDLDESWLGTYLVMDNCTIHKSKPMIKKIGSKGYRVL